MRFILLMLFLLFCATDMAAQRDTVRLGEAAVRHHRERYRRKDNPAVELMRRVIAAKEDYQWQRHHDNTSMMSYTKTTLSLNEVTPRMLESDEYFRRMPFLKEQVEVCNATGKLILPLSVNERVSRHITRLNPEDEKEIIQGERHNGVEDLIDVGAIVDVGVQDLFTRVNIMDDDVRLFQRQITSPLSSRTAISFYHFHIADTLEIEGRRLYNIFFTPANNQDLGFSGSLFITADGRYQVEFATLSLPKHTGVNWIDGLRLTQTFATLPSGERVLEDDDMVLELRIVNGVQKFQVERSTHYYDFSTDPVSPALFRLQGNPYREPNASLRQEGFWQQHRSVPLSRSEQHLGSFLDKVMEVKGFKPLIWVLRALATNSVPLTVRPGKPAPLDITPVNTIISTNPVDGLRLRLSARTTASLMPHLFLRGYVAYGFKDHRWKGLGEVTYAFNHREHITSEFPVHNLTATYQNDLMSPADLFLDTDKDNIFTSLKWAKTEHMMYFEQLRLLYEREWLSGLRIKAQLRHQSNRPGGQLEYRLLNGQTLPRLDYSEATLGLSFRPGAAYMNTKQGRRALNGDAPLYSLSHTMGFPGFWHSRYRYNLTEAELYRRFQLNSWGRLDVDVRGGVQWNRVPFPLLIMPASNLSYIKQKNTFALINNMEFLSDRYASLMVSWDLGGKLFNRIPLLRRLKWREYLGVNVLWSTLSSKNDPLNAANQGSDYLMRFPGSITEEGLFVPSSYAMNPRRPYVEGLIGIHNILNILHVEYVHRFTYTKIPTAQRWGIRFRIELSF